MKKEEKYELFDSRIKEMVDSCSETPSEDVWKGIEKELDRRSGLVFWRKAVRYGAAAAVAATLLVTPFMMRHGDDNVPEVAVAEASVEPAEAVMDRSGSTLKALPELLAQARVQSDPVAAAAKELRRPQVQTSAVVETSGMVGDTAAGDEAECSVPDVSGIPSIYDRASRADYIAMMVDEPQDAADEHSGAAFSVSAGGNLSPTRASGNVDFSQPSYTWGAAGSSSNVAGIVPATEPRHYFPVSVGLELKYSFLDNRLGVGLGVNYTFLNSRYEALVDHQFQASVDQSVHYLGVPLNFYVGILSSDRLSFYASAGCMMERAVKVSYDITDLHSVTYKQHRKAEGLQWSANVGLGLEYRFIDFMGLYVDPRLTYFFDCDQPYSVRTEQPLQFNLEMGFRFHIGA